MWAAPQQENPGMEGKHFDHHEDKVNQSYFRLHYYKSLQIKNTEKMILHARLSVV